MSYANQPDHEMLDRHLVRDFLLDLTHSITRVSPGPGDRSEHLRQLRTLCESTLESDWLDFLEAHNLHLPDAAQRLIEVCQTRPDFLYREQSTVIYIDGPVHDQPDVAAEDNEIRERLEDHGFTVVRFGYRKDEWPGIATEHSYLFGNIE